MKKKDVVKNKRDFNDIIQHKSYVKNDYFVIYKKKKDQENPKFGIAVSKKTGNAVTRNRLKRQVRVIIDNNRFLFPKTYDYIIMIKKRCLEISFYKMNEEFEKLLKEKVK